MVNLHEFVSIAILFVYFRTRKQTMEASTKLQLSTNLGNQTQPLPLTSKVKYPIADTTIRNHIISLSPNINTKNTWQDGCFGLENVCNCAVSFASFRCIHQSFFLKLFQWSEIFTHVMRGVEFLSLLSLRQVY